MPTTVLDRVRQIVAEQHGLPVSEIRPETHFFDDLDDSLDFVEIVMTCGEEFAIEIADAEAERLATVADLASHISGKLTASVWPPPPNVPEPPAV